MNLYTHLVMAREVEPLMNPSDPADYYWGAIFPDVRYLAGIARSATHLPVEQIDTFRESFPHLRSFLLGYRVHCLLDLLDVPKIISAKPPLRLFRRWLKAQHMVMIVEFYYLHNGRFGHLVSGVYNDVMIALGISPEDSAAFAAAANQYIASPTFDTAVEAFRGLGMVRSERAEQYIHAGRQVSRSPFIRFILNNSVAAADLPGKSRAMIQGHPVYTSLLKTEP